MAIELSESGTGVGQALSILYVALNSKHPQTILIDEPNSFLHPAAAKKLVDLLRELRQHQYIVTTHSPEILMATKPSTLLMIRWEPPQAVLERLDTGKLSDLRSILLEVGAKLADVFGADRIFWVEGDTEEDCFRLLLQDENNMRGTNIVAVRSTGDFQSRRIPPEAIVAMYERLAKGRAIVPPAVGFLFDRETRTESQIQDLQHRTGQKLQFLPRRMYENYLLNPAALAALIDTLLSFRHARVTETELATWLTLHGGEARYCSPPIQSVQLTDVHWLTKVNAARLLEDMFEELSDGKYQFAKREHCYWLTGWLLTHVPDQFRELKSFIFEIFQNASASQ